jgi:hypothetical protein
VGLQEAAGVEVEAQIGAAVAVEVVVEVVVEGLEWVGLLAGQHFVEG